ncbi:hypothetical protein [Scytonema sp. NUACC26]|uniref:hypothetical protein n=1 Tax=Scytonema sp. NUACC26 TaxID=3140176 RepID=UPI0034DB978B
MIYIPITSELIAQSLSKALYELSRPLSTQLTEDVSEYYCGWLVHPITKEVVLILPEDDLLPVNSLANDRALDKFLKPFQNAQKITGEDIEKVRNAIATNKDKQIKVIDFLPQYWLDSAKTQEQLEGGNWFINNMGNSI